MANEVAVKTPGGLEEIRIPEPGEHVVPYTHALVRAGVVDSEDVDEPGVESRFSMTIFQVLNRVECLYGTLFYDDDTGSFHLVDGDCVFVLKWNKGGEELAVVTVLADDGSGLPDYSTDRFVRVQ